MHNYILSHRFDLDEMEGLPRERPGHLSLRMILGMHINC